MLDLFNLFESTATATNLGSVYAGGSIHPIEGGSVEDLVFLKTDTGSNPIRTPTYNIPTAFQTPFTAVLSVRRAF